MKNNNRINKITAVVVLSILLLFMFSVFLRVAALVMQKTGIENSFTRVLLFDRAQYIEEQYIDSIDWSFEYPFEDANFEKKDESLYEKALNIIDVLEDEINHQTSNNLIGRLFLVEAGHGLEKMMKWSLAPKIGRIPISIYDNYYAVMEDYREVNEAIESIADFSDFCKSQNMPLLYVEVPSKICKEDSEIAGLYDYSNEIIDNTSGKLWNLNIPFIDVRRVLHENGINHNSAFYETDHHWTAETGFFITGVIIDQLNSLFNLNIDKEYLNSDNFNFIVYPNIFLGAYGKKVSIVKAIPEDITLISPKETYDLHYVRGTSQGIVQDEYGDFDILIDYNQLREGDYYNKNSYSAYMHGDNVSLIENRSVDNDYNILMVGSSYTNVVESFLALGVNRLDCIDLRAFNGSLESFIYKNGPYDAVILVYGLLPEEVNYDTHEDLFDFR